MAGALHLGVKSLRGFRAFRVEGSGIRDQGLGFRDLGLGFARASEDL